jgi:hypothetical protein
MAIDQYEKFKDKNSIDRLFGIGMDVTTCKRVLTQISEIM